MFFSYFIMSWCVFLIIILLGIHWSFLDLYIYRFHYICKIWDQYLIFYAYSHPFLEFHFIYVRYLVVVWEVTRLCSIFFQFFRRLMSVRNILCWERDGDFQKLEHRPLLGLLWSAWEMSWHLWVCHVARVLYNEHIMGPEVYWKSYFSAILSLLLLLSHFSRIQLCVTP